MMKRSLIYTTFLIFGTFALPTVSFAQEEDDDKKVEEDEKIQAQLKSLNIKGRASYRSKDFKGAIDAFQKAYDIKPVPNLLFNIAKCHEKLKDWDNAIKYYNKFVVAPDIKPDTRKETLDRIEELRKIKAIEEENKNKKKKIIPPQKPPEADNTLAYVLMGSGGALIGVGAVFGILANGQQSTFESATTTKDKLAARDTGTTYGYVADAGFGLGLITAGVGLVLFLTSSPEVDTQNTKTTTDKASTQFSPWLSPEGGGFTMQLRF